MSSPISVILADDHPVLRNGLRQTVAADSRLRVVGEAGDGAVALELIEQLRPDVAVLDVDMPRLDGLGVATGMRERRLASAIIFLTIHDEEDLFHAAIDVGAKGYVLKDSALSEIVEGILAVAAGRHHISSSLIGYLVQRRERQQEFSRSQSGLDALTATERRILGLIAADKSSKEIAAELFIHYRTVENHRNNVCQKLGLHGHNALLRFALQNRSRL